MAIEALFTAANWVDAVLVMVVLLYGWQAYERGMVAVLCEFSAWLAAWMVGALVRQGLAAGLVIHLGLKGLAYRQWSYLLTVILVQLLVYRGLSALAQKLPRHYFSETTHIGLAMVPAIINGVFFAALVFMVLVALPFWYPLKEELLSSRTAEYLLFEWHLLGP